MSYIMFLDDIRDPKKYYPEQDVVLCRTYNEAVAYVNTNGLPKEVSFDHDLGDTSEDEKTGYTFAKFLIDYMIENNIDTFFEFKVHSSNPVGADNIRNYIISGFNYINSQKM